MFGGNWKRNENVTPQSTASFLLACSFSIYTVARETANAG